MLTENRNFLSTLQIKNKQELNEFFATSDLFHAVAQGKQITKILDGVVVANLFLEPSTRTRLSFESAVFRLGGQSITVTGTDIISVVKGESYSDTARVISGYSDLIVLRTSSPDITEEFVRGATKPVINGGSGGDEHPTQALLDIYTAEQELKKRGKSLDRSHIALIGDLRYGRTVHSLIKLLRLYEGITFHVISPDGLELPNSIIEVTKDSKHNLIKYAENDLSGAISQADIIYATRLQKERLGKAFSLNAYPAHLRLDSDLVGKHAKDDVIIMHPLPRDSRPDSNDLPFASNDTRLVIFNQTDNGIPIRMALICKVFQRTDSQIIKSFIPAAWN